MKKLFSLLAALALCLSLAACGGEDDDPGDVVGGDWRVTGIVRDSGTITRNGEDTDVLVCVHADSADFYLDDEVQTLYDYVGYPITLQSDPWEAFQGIDFADRNGDGSSDAAILFELEGQQALMVWFWDAETETFVFQPEESLVENFVDGDTAHQGLDGTWYLEGEDTAESVIGIGVAGDWILYEQSDDTLTAVDSGMLRVLDEAQGHYAADSERFDPRCTSSPCRPS